MTKDEILTRAFAMYGGLNSIIVSWDPYGLSSAGEISDEFSEEVWQVLHRLPEASNPGQVAAVIAEVFAASFSTNEFSPATCREVGQRVYTWWASQD
jgi:hypothetical protein